MNISHISVSTLPVLHRFGGAIERRIVEIAQEQARRGHRVSVYSAGDTTETRDVGGGALQTPKGRTLQLHRQPEGQCIVEGARTTRGAADLLFPSPRARPWTRYALVTLE